MQMAENPESVSKELIEKIPRKREQLPYKKRWLGLLGSM